MGVPPPSSPSPPAPSLTWGKWGPPAGRPLCRAAGVGPLEEEIDDTQCNKELQRSRSLWCALRCVVESGTICTQKASWCAKITWRVHTKWQNTPKETFLIHWITFGVPFPVLCTKIALLKLNLRRVSMNTHRHSSDVVDIK